MVSGHSLAMDVRHRRTVMRGGGLGEFAPQSVDQVEQFECVAPMDGALGLRTTAQFCETVWGHATADAESDDSGASPLAISRADAPSSRSDTPNVSAIATSWPSDGSRFRVESCDT